MEIQVALTITKQHWMDAFVAAYEGWSNSWAEINEDTSKLPYAGTYGAPAERIASALWEGTFELEVYDVEEPKVLLGTVTQASMKKAWEILGKEYPHVLSALLNDTADATDGDVLFQLATMGEYRFG